MTWLARRALKAPLFTKGVLRSYLYNGDRAGGHAFLIYHRIDGGLNLELDIEPDIFERQVAFLAESERVIGYEEALAELSSEKDSAPDFVQPAYVLTFDDGYLDFYTRVYPLLHRHGLPAILFVTTGFVEEGKPYPMLSNPSANPKPVTWDMLGEMAESRLVTLGAHTHTHPVLTDLIPERLEAELERPLYLFKRRLGMRPRHFAYPRAQTTADVSRQVARHYDSAVVGGGHRATAEGFDRYAIPRLPIRRSDGWRFFRAKLHGWLDDEERVYEHLREARERISK